MINPLAIATRGRISQSVKKTLTLATLGWLVFVSQPPVTQPVQQIAVSTGPTFFGGSRGSTGFSVAYDGYEKDLKDAILRDDEEVLTLIIKTWLQCQK